jgi:hypothetical protein
MNSKRLFLLLIFVLLAASFSLYSDWLVFGQEADSIDVQKCTICHGKQDYKRLIKQDGHEANLFVSRSSLGGSVHKDITCGECHSDIQVLPHVGVYVPEPVDCSRCHFEGNSVKAPQSKEYQTYWDSAHGQALIEGKENAPRCQNCHGSHDIQFIKSGETPVAPHNIAATCGACHEKENAEWAASSHGKGREENGGTEQTPTCTDCHGNHDIFNKEDSRSHTFHANIPESCSKCHNEKEITESLDNLHERVETFENSFHGVAIRFGSMIAANCASCHGYHKVLPAEDPESMVHIDNVPETCGQTDCHPGAGVNFSIGQVHVNPHDEESGAVYYIAKAFMVLTISVIAALIIHILFDLTRRILGPNTKNKKEKSDGK